MAQIEIPFVRQNATNKELDWSVSNSTGTASISEQGLLTAANPGTVLELASAKDGSVVNDLSDRQSGVYFIHTFSKEFSSIFRIIIV